MRSDRPRSRPPSQASPIALDLTRTMTTPTEDPLVMPHPILTRITGRPNHKSVKKVTAQLLANCVSIPSDRGNGRLGHAILVMDPAEHRHNSHGGVDYDVPTKPMPPRHATAASVQAMHNAEAQHMSHP